MYTADPDTKSHYSVIIIGAGVSGIAANIQLRRKENFTDVICYEMEEDLGGTWAVNTYPGAACDIPAALYSYSFAQKDWGTHWPGQKALLAYIHDVVDQFDLRNIHLQTTVVDASYAEGIWSIRIKDLVTGVEKVKTCNVLISAAGGLRVPSLPPFAIGNTGFEGDVFHSARWDHSISLKGKNVVVVGNGSSGTQIVPAILKDAASVTHVARSRQTFLPPPPLPSNRVWWFFSRWLPGFFQFQRILIYFGAEADFLLTDIERGASMRAKLLRNILTYLHAMAPEKYWEALTPDFEPGAKRRVYEVGYLKALHDPKFTLIQDDTVVSMKGRSVRSEKGIEIPADVVVCSTGFRVQDYLFPLKVTSEKGVNLVARLKETGARMYRGTCCSGFPNFFVLLGPNTATGHSSVIFTSEAQINMVLALIKPILAKLKKDPAPSSPLPTVEVTAEAERIYYDQMRAEMRKKVWEKDGGVSWYVDSETRLCTSLYPWSQTNFWYHATWPTKSDFLWNNC